jgi:S-adenosylmethionine:tRNA ribosyltransferase-isomerase
VKISEFNYELPEELIAQHPLTKRDASRMLVVDRKSHSWTDSQFTSFVDYVRSEDVLVMNNTRVFPARLIGEREGSHGRVEILLLKELEPLIWEALVRPGNRLKEGSAICFHDSRLRAELLDEPGKEIRKVRFDSKEGFDGVLETIGDMPLPPYIRRPLGTSAEDRQRYQTVFARERGAIAAPTAGLHFTPDILRAIEQRGTALVELTLHIGYGTFEPVRVQDAEEHQVRPEEFELTEAAAETINSRRRAGGRVIAVGTTTTRALETSSDDSGLVQAKRGLATLTIIPGYKFRATDVLLTNFHLPCSSLLLLVSAFAGREFTLEAYRHAVAEGYRFYSYGDCMLIR